MVAKITTDEGWRANTDMHNIPQDIKLSIDDKHTACGNCDSLGKTHKKNGKLLLLDAYNEAQFLWTKENLFRLRL
jgi:hypothetical protein